MKIDTIGIVGNTLVIGPFYGGDHYHTSTVDNYTKKNLIERGITEYPDFDHIEAIVSMMNYEDYMEMMKRISDRQDEERTISCVDDLPF